MYKINLSSGFGVGLLLAASYGYAVDVRPSAELQVQAEYVNLGAVDSGDWSVQLPVSRFGVSATEALDSGRFDGRLSFEADTGTDSSVQLTRRFAYLTWRQGVMNLWAGQLPSLEYSYLQSPFNGLYSLQSKGIGLSDRYSVSENQAVRVEAASGEYIVLASQWILEKDQSELPWQAAGIIQTPEGHISLTYRKPPGESVFWGSQITWIGQQTELSAVWGYQDEFLEWDTFLTYKSESLKVTAGYGKRPDDATRWSLGIYQPLSQAITSYSELIFWSGNSDDWHWNTGFNMTF